MNIGDTFPNFQANTTIGNIDFYQWLDKSYVICTIYISCNQFIHIHLSEGQTFHPQTQTQLSNASFPPLFLRWGVLFSHPADFTPVCTTELARVAQLYPEFLKRNVKPIALSCDSAESHLKWIGDIKSYGNLDETSAFPYPIIDDAARELAVKLNMLDRDEINSQGLALTCRAVFVIDPSKKLRLSILYPASSGRNFE